VRSSGLQRSVIVASQQRTAARAAAVEAGFAPSAFGLVLHHSSRLSQGAMRSRSRECASRPGSRALSRPSQSGDERGVFRSGAAEVEYGTKSPPVTLEGTWAGRAAGLRPVHGGPTVRVFSDMTAPPPLVKRRNLVNPKPRKRVPSRQRGQGQLHPPRPGRQCGRRGKP
jgi:hypothetical protein